MIFSGNVLILVIISIHKVGDYLDELNKEKKPKITDGLAGGF